MTVQPQGCGGGDSMIAKKSNDKKWSYKTRVINEVILFLEKKF